MKGNLSRAITFYRYQTRFRLIDLLVGLGIFWVASGSAALAQSQIVPDNTLGDESSQVVPNNNEINGIPTEAVEGGAQRGSNLFHSFSQFSIETGRGAYFANPEGINNIFSRVTGNNVSEIFGTLGVLGNANLFLLNPNGIIFGENASLDLNGSFLATTASGVLFENNLEFNATNPQVLPLLEIDIPIGLQMGFNPGNITVRGTGNNFSLDPDIGSIVRDNRPTGLQVESDRTLALIGGNILLEGGILTAPGGRIELGGVGSEEIVNFTFNNSNWIFNYQNTNNFQDILLSQAAAVDSSGSGRSDIQLQGKRINIDGASAVLASPLASFSGGELEISAVDEIVLSGISEENNASGLNSFVSIISTDVATNATGNAANLTLETESLKVVNGGQIGSGTYGIGNGSNLNITAGEIEVSGSTPFRPSGIFNNSEPGAMGNGGNLTIETERLFVSNGGSISSNTFSSGNAGTLKIQSSEIELIGQNIAPFTTGLSSSVQSESLGNGGDLTIETERLFVSNGAIIFSGTTGNLDGGDLLIFSKNLTVNNEALILSSTEGAGNAGDLSIKTETLEINNAQIGSGTFGTGDAGELNITAQDINIGGFQEPFLFSGIYSSGGLVGGAGRGGNLTIETSRLKIFDGGSIAADTLGTGNAGNLKINAVESIELQGNTTGLDVSATAGSVAGNLTIETGRMTVADGAFVTVDNTEGQAGNLQITADSLSLDRGAITAFTKDDNLNGANINLQIENNLTLNNRSLILANALGDANGGNINIDTEFIVGFSTVNSIGSSDIIADAVRGRGGRIDITANGVFGIESRANLTALNDISASSEFGLSGEIVLNLPQFDPIASTLNLPEQPTEAKVSRVCSTKKNDRDRSEFTVTGRGGLSESPSNTLESKGGWEDWGIHSTVTKVNLPSQSSLTSIDLDSSNNEQEPAIVEAQGWMVNQKGKVVLTAGIEPQFTHKNHICQSH